MLPLLERSARSASVTLRDPALAVAVMRTLQWRLMRCAHAGRLVDARSPAVANGDYLGDHHSKVAISLRVGVVIAGFILADFDPTPARRRWGAIC